MKIPIELRLNGNTLAQINSFGYETPWATGKVSFDDEELFLKLVKVTSMSCFDLEVDDLGVSEEEEEKLWEEKLTKLGITWDDLKLARDENWTIISQGEEEISIRSPKFYEAGYMDWRM